MLINGERLSDNVNVNVRTLSFSKEKERLNVKNVNVQNKAMYLIEKFEKIGCLDAKKCLNYFIKCFNSLPENVIWDLFEKASSNPEIRSKIKYFIASCRNQMISR